MRGDLVYDRQGTHLAKPGPTTHTPRPLRGTPTRDRDIVFYDGGCGFCHASVAFLVARDHFHAFDYAPLQGETFRRVVPEGMRASLPDSVLLATADGRILTRSRATAAMLRRLPGAWPLLGRLLSLLPRSLADLAYDAVARRRKALFPPPEGACPLVPLPLRERFLP